MKEVKFFKLNPEKVLGRKEDFKIVFKVSPYDENFDLVEWRTPNGICNTTYTKERVAYAFERGIWIEVEEGWE